MRIVIINWRSIHDPLEGGAERATFEFAKRWVLTKKAEVTWISPRYKNGPQKEDVDGVKFIYLGKPLSRNIFALVFAYPLFFISVVYYYFKNLKNQVDIIIDQVHGLPYLTPLFVKEKKVIYIHEVAGGIWDLMYPFPINILGKIAERIYFLPYKLLNIKFIANSPSTVNDLVTKLFINKLNIQIVPYGVTAPENTTVISKNESLTVIFLNRIVKMKGIERGLKAFKLVVNEHPEAQLTVVGRGEDDYLEFLKKMCDELGIGANVKFIGFVDGESKYALLAKAHVLMNPSHLEGWGLVNIEANRMGTPVVAFKVRGCVDSVKENVSGFLCDDDDLACFAKKIIKAGNDSELRSRSIEYSKQFSWDIQADRFYSELESTLKS